MKAKRGDLIIIERRTSYHHAQTGRHESLVYEVGIVTSITREGAVKAVRYQGHDYSTQLRWIFDYSFIYLLPQHQIDVQAAYTAALGTDALSKTYDSLGAVRETIRPYLTQASDQGR